MTTEYTRAEWEHIQSLMRQGVLPMRSNILWDRGGDYMTRICDDDHDGAGVWESKVAPFSPEGSAALIIPQIDHYRACHMRDDGATGRPAT